MTYTTILQYDPTKHTYVVLETVRKKDEGEIDPFAEFERVVTEILNKDDDLD